MSVRTDKTPSHAAPSVGRVALIWLRNAVLPALVWTAILFGIGYAFRALDNLPGESGVNTTLAAGRTATMNAITAVWSTMNDTWWTIGLAFVYAAIVWVLTKRWWWAVVPLGAITIEASVFVPVTNIIDRPRPEVEHLDPAPPTSSFPSGHTAASFALYYSLLLIAGRIPNVALRRVVQVICAVLPFLVAYSRLYRGMHHLSDVIVGAIFGLWCAWAAYRCGKVSEEARGTS